MNYYEVAVASHRYHGQELLTYSSEEELSAGSIISVPLQRQKCLAFVIAEVTKPAFNTKGIASIHPVLPLPQQSLKLFQWLRNYYPAPLGIIAQLFIPKDLPGKISGNNPKAHKSTAKELPPLTDEQLEILRSIKQTGTHILHGETGSGKTRVYIELAQKELHAGRSCIILTPEISLTSQLAQSFAAALPDFPPLVFHSHLTLAARRNLWLQIRSATDPLVVIGPRSALFSPIANIGLIVVDESHETAYKQENAPHYHASRVASKLAELHEAKVIFGSATPSVQDYYLAQQKQRPILRMTSSAKKTALLQRAEVVAIDMREKSNLSSIPHFSQDLLHELKDSLSGKKQSLLFLNRRGTARIILCNNCGWQAECPHCDLPLTYHHDKHQFRCHSCDFHMAAVSSCPTCSNTDITLKSAGTKAIETSIHKLLPSARIARFDADNIKGERFHELYDEVHSGDIDIIIGTQMLAKGLDLPKLGLVGMINADASLYIPDFGAQERTFQLLYQLIGRVGRGHDYNGKVIVQTYMPDNPALQSALRKDYDAFYRSELQERQQFMFPPYCHVLKLSCRRASSASALKNAERTLDLLMGNHPGITIEGPAPSFHEKVAGKYTWQLIVKTNRRDTLLHVIDDLPSDWTFDIDPIDLL